MSAEPPHIILPIEIEAVELLRILVEWGYGYGASDLAKDDWREAREWLERYDERWGI